MPSLTAGQEILLLCTILKLQAFTYIGARMTVNDIQQHPDAHAVGCIDQFLQFLGISVPVGSSKEIGHLVSE